MRIDELEEYAKEHGFDSLEFEFTNLKGEVKKCKWLDAYMGLFVIEGSGGFIKTSDWKQYTGDVFEFRICDEQNTFDFNKV
jgi:hypothetical protein